MKNRKDRQEEQTRGNKVLSKLHEAIGDRVLPEEVLDDLLSEFGIEPTPEIKENLRDEIANRILDPKVFDKIMTKNPKNKKPSRLREPDLDSPSQNPPAITQETKGSHTSTESSKEDRESRE